MCVALCANSIIGIIILDGGRGPDVHVRVDPFLYSDNIGTERFVMVLTNRATSLDGFGNFI